MSVRLFTTDVETMCNSMSVPGVTIDVSSVCCGTTGARNTSDADESLAAKSFKAAD